MLTKAAHKALGAAYAGGTWECGYSTARLSSDPRAGLQEVMRQAQNGVCAFCGERAREAMEMCHIYPGGYSRLGWTPGNIALGCPTCNDIDGESIVEYSTILRPDLVLTEWPSTPTLKGVGNMVKREREKRRLIVAHKRGM